MLFVSHGGQPCHSLDGLLVLLIPRPTAAAAQQVLFTLATALLMGCTGYGESRIRSLGTGEAVRGELRGGEVATCTITRHDVP